MDLETKEERILQGDHELEGLVLNNQTPSLIVRASKKAVDQSVSTHLRNSQFSRVVQKRILGTRQDRVYF
jgi:hypothetical protein